ncbi:MAG TPA: BsuBI/PstI family type II restriction endonuclease [Candidatus Angelobacter sp.]|jgi:adenine-specific DNA-methyltransferase|nr:BsuBI/PstI family type II restriction endonuclease [Candidatus Angelobacter sp.]
MSNAANFDCLAKVDSLRLQADRTYPDERKADLGQFFTPAPIARLMASMFAPGWNEIKLLDPGAGIGTLTVAFVQECCNRELKPKRIAATLFEVDQLLAPYLNESIRLCHDLCLQNGIEFTSELHMREFIAAAEDFLRRDLFFGNLDIPRFNCAILNPPYRKIHSESIERKRLKSLGIETSNLYTGFLAVTIKLLEESGEFVSITPRSFCNGEYFLPFRKQLLDETTIQRIHLFNSRSSTFRDDGVLQESVIVHARKHGSQREERTSILVSSSDDGYDEAISIRENQYSDVIDPADPKKFIHIFTSDLNQEFAETLKGLACNLTDLGLAVSTGPVVDFRLKKDLLAEQLAGSVPLIYPTHLVSGSLVWPSTSRKPNAIRNTSASRPWLISNGTYVFVKRFSSKEEKKRVVAVVYDKTIPAELIGIENHLNYYHKQGGSLDSELASGLAAYLNSTLVDQYFRQFNGHTQVNASDLRSLRYPSERTLRELASHVNEQTDQKTLDHEIALLLQQSPMKKNPIKIRERIKEAEEILKSLGLPREQHNERSALALLALLDLKPQDPWSSCQNPLRGITPLMEFISKWYGKKYAPNTRETIRRFTVHQMMDAGLLVANPDRIDRPTNSPDWVYQISGSALDLLRSFGAEHWGATLDRYLSSIGTLKAKYAQERQMARIPIEIEPGKVIEISPGGQNNLVELIWQEFAPRFTPGAKLIYLGDTDEKFAYFDNDHLAKLGVRINLHGKMPDVILHYTKASWLVLVEAVTSHGPINPKRRAELRTIFADSKAGLVFVTAFLDKKTFLKFGSDISWETEVWIADSPSHLIHFDGERFLGPYPD